MKKIFLAYKLVVVIALVTILTGSAFYYPPVQAKTVIEINQEIAQKQAELTKIAKDMEKLNADLNANKSQQNSFKNEISKVLNTITTFEGQIQLLDLQSKQIQEQIDLHNLEKAGVEKQQDTQVVDSYILWKMDRGMIKTNADIVKQTIYNESYQNSINGAILGLTTQINKLNQDKQSYEQQKMQLDQQVATFTQQKAILEKQIADYNNAVAAANASLNTMRGKQKGVVQSIDQLTKEQNDLLNQDNKLTAGGNGGTEAIPVGEFYFAGTGRDLYQGHGVGFSQWGAYGEAKNHGWSAEQILKLYYTGVTIGIIPGQTINVVGSGVMDIETYVAGLGEVPDRACGTNDKILAWDAYANSQGWAAGDARRNKYVIDNPSTEWDCWPEETIKAQVIAARTYGYTSSQPICTSASCQVYKGGTGKAWAAYQTIGQYILYGGKAIRAFYSADNNQGYGTANNDTAFSGYNGRGTAYAYLRHVDDTAVSGTYQYTKWAWRTNGYTLSDINAMFDFAAANYATGSSANTYVKNLKNTVGTIKNIILVKDPSQRVRYLTLVGQNNATYDIQGDLFKFIWNDWVGRTHPANKLDYIYSKTFSFIQKT